MIKRIAFLMALLSIPALAQAQSSNSSQPKPKPIQDNSFLVEEAYNQEKGVVQHINTFTRLRNGDWLYTFTQEWPVFGQKHQLGFTLPAVGIDEGDNGLGDIALNYRYQLVGSGETALAISPRVSLLLPSGDEKKGLGRGATGVQFNLPVSYQFNDHLVTHWNAGMTYTPSAKNELGQKADLMDYHLGQSFIWLATEKFNVMLESFWERRENVIGVDLKGTEKSFLLTPGVRWAHDFRNGLQIVPGIAVPVGIGPGSGERGVFFYVSFEHPFLKM